MVAANAPRCNVKESECHMQIVCTTKIKCEKVRLASDRWEQLLDCTFYLWLPQDPVKEQGAALHGLPLSAQLPF